MKQPQLKLLIALTLTLLYFPTFLNCKNLIISEVKANTCITFNKPNSTDPVYIKRNNESLCAFIREESFPKPTAWNRTFSCRINISNLSVCFSDTMVTDAGVFYIVVDNDQENTTILEVEYPPIVLIPNTQKSVEGQNLSITCSYSPGNPNTISFYWMKTNSGFRYNGQLLWIPNIGRKDSGTYTCFAENTYSSGKKGIANATIEIDVQYPPVVLPLPNVKRVEGKHVEITCNVSLGNPSSTTIYWTKSGDSGFRQSGSTLVFTSITRRQSGIYTCVAENNYINQRKGIDQQSFLLSVLYGPTFTYGQALKVSEGQSAQMTTSITSYPASNVSWFRDNLLLSTQQSVNGTTSYTITRTQCTDTGSYLVVASNGVQSKQSTKIFLYVYCSPRLTTCGSSVELHVDSDFNLNGQISVLSYPQPNASLVLPSGALNTLVTLRVNPAATNLFIITMTGSNLQSDDFGTYVLNVSNQYGRITIYVNITSRKSSSSTVVVVGSVLGGLLFLAVCALVFLSYFLVRKVSIRSYNTLKQEKATVDNPRYMYEPSTCDEKAAVEETQKISKSNPFKLSIFNIFKKEGRKKTKKYPTLETPNLAKTDELPFSKTDFTKTGKELYQNAEELAATACYQNRRNTKSEEAGDTESGNIGKKKTKYPTLKTPNWAKTKESPFTKTNFTKTETGKELYQNAEELAATACDQNGGNNKSKEAGDTESGNIGKKKTKYPTLKTPNWAKTKESPFTETKFTKTETRKELYQNAEELAATACDQIGGNNKSEEAGDTESGNIGKKKTKYPTLETSNWAKTKESPFTETNFTKTETGKELYQNAEELAATACDQNGRNNKGKEAGDTESENIGKKKTKYPKLETSNWAKTKESPLTETNFTKTKTGKELYQNAEELAAKACDQNRGNTKSKKAGDTESENIKETKSKPLVLPKPKKKLSKASKAFSYF